MSQVTIARPVPRPTRGRPQARPRLTVVQGDRAAGQGWFALVCGLLMVGGLIGVLILNTLLAQGTYELGRLQAQSSELADRHEALTVEVDGYRSPGRLAERARDLGMVPAQSPVFLRLDDGAILGASGEEVAGGVAAAASDGG